MAKSKFSIIVVLISSQIVGCSSLPQTYDSPIPVYVDLGDIKPMTTTLSHPMLKHRTKPNH